MIKNILIILVISMSFKTYSMDFSKLIKQFIMPDHEILDKDVFFNAIKNNDLDQVKKLLDNGADVNIKYLFSFTPLHKAASSSHKDIAELLIAYGANINAQCDSGWTALHWASHFGNENILKILLDNGADISIPNNTGRKAADKARTQKLKDLINSYENFVPILRR